MLSGFGAQQLSDRAVAAGADGYVQKGAPLSTILEYVRELCVAGPRVPAQSLSVVSTSSAPGADRLESVPDPAPTPEPAHDESTSASLWQALSLAPYGIVEVSDEPLFRVIHVNAVGERLLGGSRPGSPLATVAPELATLVAYHRLSADASFEVSVKAGRVGATLRRTGHSVLVYLDSATEDVGLLRRAIATTAHEIRGPVAESR